MRALAPGTKAPDFSLPANDGKVFSLREALSRGPVVLAFFKISCPVCQFAFPFFERIHRAPSAANVSIIGVSQNEAKDTARFVKEFGITFPILLEDTDKFAVSDAYGLTSVPTAFYIGTDGVIEISMVGWSRADVDEIYRRRSLGSAPPPLFQPDERIPEHRPG